MTAPRTGDTITTPEQLGALPNRTAIHDANRELWERNGTILDHLLEEGHAAWVGTTGGLCHSLEIDLPATVLYVPDEQPRPSVTNDARAALSEIRSIIEANLVQGDYEAWHERPDDTLDAIWDALNRAADRAEDIQTLDARWFERWETEQPLADKYAGYYQGRVSAIAQCREELRHMLAAARAETSTDDPHDGDGNRLTPDWQPEMTTEWAHRLANGGASIHRTRQEAEQAQRDYLHQQANLYPVDDPPGPPSAGIYRREVTEWKKSD